MIYFDLDNFKNVNDNYGHATGDKVLLQVVDIVKSIIRSSDIFARWGGGEFILLLPNTNLNEVTKISERIRYEIENLEINKSLGVTASVGCSQWKTMEYIESWFSRTDKALYTSKNTGKNKVTSNDHNSEKNILVKVKWDKSWNSGNSIIDSEHEKILERCNLIIESSLRKDSFVETLRNLDVFIEDMNQHFSDEIKILRKTNYPNTDKHELIHSALIRKSKEICKRMELEEITSIELFVFLLEVVVEGHFRNEDVKYFKYL